MSDQELQMIHDAFPKPVGKGKMPSITATMAMSNPMFTGLVMSVSNRINRGAIPFPLQDLRCSYCLKCHDEPPQRCSRCKNVSYCNRDCQKKHWAWHKSVCGTVTETWDLEEWRHENHGHDDDNDDGEGDQ